MRNPRLPQSPEARRADPLRRDVENKPGDSSARSAVCCAFATSGASQPRGSIDPTPVNIYTYDHASALFSLVRGLLLWRVVVAPVRAALDARNHPIRSSPHEK